METERKQQKIEEQLNEQIKQMFFQAMRDLLKKCVSKELQSKDIDWLVLLCTELKERINKLTPSRKDLHRQLDQSIDIQLVRQMLENNAFDKSDTLQITNCVFDRLKMLCSPSQDQHVAKVHESILLHDDFGFQISSLILESNMIIDEIERLQKEFYDTIKNASPPTK